MTGVYGAQIVTCYTSDGYCQPATLGRVVFDSPGTLGRYHDYVVKATLKVIQVRGVVNKPAVIIVCDVAPGDAINSVLFFGEF